MKAGFKRILTVVLLVCLTVTPFAQLSASAAANPGIMPLYNNTASATIAMGINSSGKMAITYKYNGFSSITTKAVITTYIEKKTLGLFWSRVDIGQPDNQWIDTYYTYTYSTIREYQLSSTGTYRVSVTYVIYGSGGSADNIPCQKTATY